MGGGNSKKKKQAPNLGRSLIRSRFSGKRNAGSDSSLREQLSQEKQNNVTLNSVTEESTINSFINEARLAGSLFDAEREGSFQLVDENNRFNLLTPEKEFETKKRNEDLRKLLNIPRRPQWTKNVTHEEQMRNENLSFLSWRRKMAELEDKNGYTMTPFERNLEVWKQLWRVLEKSDLILQIVDCRNPQLFISSDLKEYARELNENKECIVIINKSDLLTKKQRLIWAEYFKKNNIDYIFYSALTALEGSKDEPAENVSKNEPHEDGCRSDAPVVEVSSNHTTVCEAHEIGPAPILTAPQLIEFLNEKTSRFNVAGKKAVVGFIGYPNVGKSSTINSLIGKKRQQVSSTPGKTKHFQTIHLLDSIIICDCPGLVFPSFVTTKAELICNGILPIDQVKDYMSPCAFLVQRVPLEVFEKFYNIKIPTFDELPSHENPLEVNTRNLLKAFAFSRGYNKSKHGKPDESRAAKRIFKDFTNAKIILCIPPLGHDEAEFNRENFDKILHSHKDTSHDQDNNKKKPYSEQNKGPQSEKMSMNVSQQMRNLKFEAHIAHVGGSPPLVNFEDRKKAHKNLKKRQSKKRDDWTSNPFDL